MKKMFKDNNKKIVIHLKIQPLSSFLRCSVRLKADRLNYVLYMDPFRIMCLKTTSKCSRMGNNKRSRRFMFTENAYEVRHIRRMNIIILFIRRLCKSILSLYVFIWKKIYVISENWIETMKISKSYFIRNDDES